MVSMYPMTKDMKKVHMRDRAKPVLLSGSKMPDARYRMSAAGKRWCIFT